MKPIELTFFLYGMFTGLVAAAIYSWLSASSADWKGFMEFRLRRLEDLSRDTIGDTPIAPETEIAGDDGGGDLFYDDVNWWKKPRKRE